MGAPSEKLARENRGAKVKRGVSHKVLDATQALNSALREAGQPYVIIGGIAVIARGVPRHTADVDATVWAQGLDLEELMACLARHGIRGRIPDVLSFAEESQVLLLVHKPSGTGIEVSLGWLPFEREAMRRAIRVTFGRVRIPVASAEDLVVLKAVAWRDKDRSDIEHLMTLYGRRLDFKYILMHVDQLARALDEPERVAAIKKLIDRAIGRPVRKKGTRRKRT